MDQLVQYPDATNVIVLAKGNIFSVEVRTVLPMDHCTGTVLSLYSLWLPEPKPALIEAPLLFSSKQAPMLITASPYGHQSTPLFSSKHPPCAHQSTPPCAHQSTPPVLIKAPPMLIKAPP
eukprot:2092364-Pyramimonas_sp.AAC.1